MSKRVKKTLKLEVIEMVDQVLSEDSKLTDDNWLNADDETLLDLLGDLKGSNKLQDVSAIPPHKNSVPRSHYVVDNLQIQFGGDNYLLMTNSDNQTVLNNGDIIECHSVMFNVNIVCEHVVMAQQPEDNISVGELFSENYEIWRKPPASLAIQPMQDDHIVDPLFDSIPKGPNHSWPQHKDQLDFLSEHATSTVPLSHEQQMSLIQPADYQNHQSAQEECGGLNVNIDENYRPASSRTDDITAPSIQEAFSTSAEQGNVMRDLGINEDASAITNKIYHNQSQPYGEQSPFDMLDELLVDNGEQPQAMESDMSTSLYENHKHSPLTKNLKGIFKKFKQKPV